MGAADFFEIYVETPLELCEERDPKGLYKKARAGEIPNFTGISDPYEAPENAELVIKTADCTLEEAALQVISLLAKAGKISTQ
jgi:adenylylsulfate kinase-like enzyme